MFLKIFNNLISTFKNGLEDWFNCFYYSTNWNYLDLNLILKILYFFIFFYLTLNLIDLNITIYTQLAEFSSNFKKDFTLHKYPFYFYV